MDHKIGLKAKDRITGFSGTVTAYCEYITGCNQCLVAPPVDDKGGYVECHWFDEQRLEFEEGQARVILDNGAHPGPDKPAPKR